MANQRPRTAEQRRRHRAGTQAAMKRRAQSLRCPKCERLNAIVRVKDSNGLIVVCVCRYCKHEMARTDPYDGPSELCSEPRKEGNG